MSSGLLNHVVSPVGWVSDEGLGIEIGRGCSMVIVVMVVIAESGLVFDV